MIWCVSVRLEKKRDLQVKIEQKSIRNLEQYHIKRYFRYNYSRRSLERICLENACFIGAIETEY